MEIQFFKYQGTGNDFIILDNRNTNWVSYLDESLIRSICTRRTGIGADGLILLNASDQYDFEMIYYNSDGKLGSMCGNGGRCLLKFAQDLGINKDTYRFEAFDGVHEGWIEDHLVILGMGQPKGYQSISDSEIWVDTGSPHYVSFQDKSIQEIDVFEQGSAIRQSEVFQPDGVNVNFINVVDQNYISVRTYERGVENETLSCGTGVVASAYAYLQQNGHEDGSVQVETLGGTLYVQFDLSENGETEVRLKGPAQKVFEGKIMV